MKKGKGLGLEDLKGPEYRYLGKFAKKEFLEKGHNFMKSEKGSNILGAVSSGLANMARAAAYAGLLKKPEEVAAPEAEAGTVAAEKPEVLVGEKKAEKAEKKVEK